MRNHGNIDFVIPLKGTFMVLENMVIPATTKRADLVYQFLNFMYKPEIVNNHIKSTYFFSPSLVLTTRAYPMILDIRFSKARFLSMFNSLEMLLLYLMLIRLCLNSRRIEPQFVAFFFREK